jgi:hypothetical protein
VLWNLNDLDTRDCMSRLVTRSLAKLEFREIVIESGAARITFNTRDLSEEEDDALILHDLQRDFIRNRRKKDLPRIHGQLIDSWGDPMDLKDEYSWRWIARYLSQSGRNAQLKELLLNFRWLQAKLRSTDPEALLKDYDYAPSDPCFRLIAEAIRLSIGPLTVDHRQLAGQLSGRLCASTDSTIRDF